jgi:predicted RNase H-like HicB family nuclease
MKSLVDYTIIVRPDDNNTYVAYVPAIKGCHAWGKSEQEARLELNNVFDMILEEYLAQNKVLPDDVEIKVVAHAQ